MDWKKTRLLAAPVGLLIAIGNVVGAHPAAASGGTMTCYSDAYDEDKDGYAKGATPIDKPKGINCPDGFVRFNDDCNDETAAVRPRRAEVAGNNISDDCREPDNFTRVDEAEPVYSATGNGNTTSSFLMTVRLNHNDVIALGGELYVDVEVEKLSGNHLWPQPRQRAVTWSQYAADLGWAPARYARVQVTGLGPATAYRARLRFYSSSGAEVGSGSDWYYTTTEGMTGTSPARTAILLKGFKQFGDSLRSLVGYRGTEVDGTRYGASRDEMWCSEFYVYNTRDRLDGISGRRTVDGIISYFASHYAWHYGTGRVDDLAARGDYLALDTDGDGKKNHSAMVLQVWTASNGQTKVATLEGNVDNMVAIKERTVDEKVKGLGHIVASMT